MKHYVLTPKAKFLESKEGFDIINIGGEVYRLLNEHTEDYRISVKEQKIDFRSKTDLDDDIFKLLKKNWDIEEKSSYEVGGYILVQPRYQLTLPKKLREALGIKGGTCLVFLISPDRTHFFVKDIGVKPDDLTMKLD